MSQLFIANISKQHHTFYYRVPERVTPLVEDIPLGTQIRVPGDLSRDVIDYIVKQHEVYGMIPASEVGKNRKFSGLCYSIDKPVQITTIGEAYEKNDQALNVQSDEKRAITAEAIAEQNRRFAQEANLPLQRTEIEMIEETKGKSSDLAVGFESPSEGVEPRRGATKKGRKGH